MCYYQELDVIILYSFYLYLKKINVLSKLNYKKIINK